MQKIRNLTVLDQDHAMKVAAYASEADFDSMALLLSLPAGGCTVYEALDPLVGYVLRSEDLDGTVKAMYGGKSAQGDEVFLVSNLPLAPAGA